MEAVADLEKQANNDVLDTQYFSLLMEAGQSNELLAFMQPFQKRMLRCTLLVLWRKLLVLIVC